MYGNNFFKRRMKKYHDKEVKLAKTFYGIFKPKSVCDVGCALGSYLEGFRQCGIISRRLCGYEKHACYARKYAVPEIKNRIYHLDAGQPKIHKESFDLVLCVEVAEHLPEDQAEVLMKNLASLKSTNGFILMTTAGKDQPGTGHINCQPQKYWFDMAGKNKLHLDFKCTQDVKTSLMENGDPLDLAKNVMVLK